MNLHVNAMWSTSHFPAAMRSLNPTTRAKAIEIANNLLEQGQFDNHRVVAMSIDEARRWARLSRTESGWAGANVGTFA
ncbi:DUF2188 domain-containing protein [Spirosoma radiotolerans]|uniref:DUF2188 domain-containing protein n=1 Tax=Spirosoma radiotolerans TaxID=1379870 RepID=A0A0E3ZWK8_9BACT|nr:hypothetical protein [Spirosoma radiotolerans]AKD56664.1 hypothetical protein SD10_18920 [Spirosoma radiotolerans]